MKFFEIENAKLLKKIKIYEHNYMINLFLNRLINYLNPIYFFLFWAKSALEIACMFKKLFFTLQLSFFKIYKLIKSR